MIGSSNEVDNEKAYQQVIRERAQEEITHGVDVLTWNDEKNQVHFTLWDFAGHEEYHVKLWNN